MEALAQAHWAPLSKNEYLDIFDHEPESGSDVLEIDMESFRSVIQSNLNNHTFYYSGDLDRTNRHWRSEIKKTANLIGQEFFAAWEVPNPAYSKEESKVPVTMRQYKKMDISPR